MRLLTWTLLSLSLAACSGDVGGRRKAPDGSADDGSADGESKYDGACPECPEPPVTVCGDDACDGAEECTTCDEDCGACPGALPTVVRGPYLQMGSETAVTVRWRTAEASTSRVWWGTAPEELLWSASDAAAVTEHEVRITGLAKGQRYFYAAGVAEQRVVGDATHTFTTHPVKGSTGPVRVWALGDAGTANANQEAVRDAFLTFAGTRKPDLWLMLGDNAYDDGTDAEYQAAVFDMYPETLRQAVLWPTIGNHDAHTSDGAPYYAMFTMPTQAEAGGLASGTEAYYSFDYANIHFVCLDSQESDRDTDGPMLAWLEDDLTMNAQTWTIAFWHHPPYTKGSHDSDSEGQLIDMRENALPILEAHGVDLVLTGHSHSYERSNLLHRHYGVSSTLESTMVLDDGDGRADGDGAYDKTAHGGDGAVYVVAGSSGKRSGGDLDHPAMFISLNELGSVVLDVEDRALDLTFLDDEGAVRDYLTLKK